MVYTEVSEQEAARLLSEADVAALREMRPLDGGWANSNHLLILEDDSRLVLKVWDERDPDEVDRVIENTCWIAEHGVPTPVPLLLQNGRRMLVEEGRAWMLMPYIDGGWLPSDAASLHDLGRLQARLHEVPVHENIPRVYSVGYSLWQRLVDTARAADSLTPFLRRLEAEMTSLRRSIPEDLPTGVIHGDLFPDNVIGRRGEVLALLDFEEICVESLALDLAMTYVGFGWRDGSPVTESWQALLAGYQSVRRLTEAEHAALPDLHRYAVLAVAAWRYHQFVIEIPGTEHADRYKEMVDRLDKPLPF